MSVSIPLPLMTAAPSVHPQAKVSDPDRPVIEQCLAGHPHGFRELYQRHQQRVRSLLFQLCGAIATVTTAWLLKPPPQVTQDYSPDSVEAFISHNWQVIFHESDLSPSSDLTVID